MSDMTPPPPPPAAPPAAPPAPPFAPPTGDYMPASENSKILAGLGYIIWIVALVGLLLDPYKDEPFVRFHSVQALALWAIAVVLGWIPFVGWLLAIVLIVFAIMAAINAFQGKYYEVPVLGGLLKGWFNV
jgi:uncharacterized membrane protein